MTELVVVLTGAGDTNARIALNEAIGRNGDAGDNLVNIADAVVSLRARPQVTGPS